MAYHECFAHSLNVPAPTHHSSNPTSEFDQAHLLQERSPLLLLGTPGTRVWPLLHRHENSYGQTRNVFLFKIDLGQNLIYLVGGRPGHTKTICQSPLAKMHGWTWTYDMKHLLDQNGRFGTHAGDAHPIELWFHGGNHCRHCFRDFHLGASDPITFGCIRIQPWVHIRIHM